MDKKILSVNIIYFGIHRQSVSPVYRIFNTCVLAVPGHAPQQTGSLPPGPAVTAVRCAVRSAVQRSAVQCSAVRCSAVRCSAVQCSAVQCSAVQRSAQCGAAQCGAAQCSAQCAVRSAVWPPPVAFPAPRPSESSWPHADPRRMRFPVPS